MLRKGLSQDMAFEQRTGGSEGQNQASICQGESSCLRKRRARSSAGDGVPMTCPGTMRRSLWPGHPE